jgi:hypothetical protein
MQVQARANKTPPASVSADFRLEASKLGSAGERHRRSTNARTVMDTGRYRRQSDIAGLLAEPPTAHWSARQLAGRRSGAERSGYGGLRPDATVDGGACLRSRGLESDHGGRARRATPITAKPDMACPISGVMALNYRFITTYQYEITDRFGERGSYLRSSRGTNSRAGCGGSAATGRATAHGSSPGCGAQRELQHCRPGLPWTGRRGSGLDAAGQWHFRRRRPDISRAAQQPQREAIVEASLQRRLRWSMRLASLHPPLPGSYRAGERMLAE